MTLPPPTTLDMETELFSTPTYTPGPFTPINTLDTTNQATTTIPTNSNTLMPTRMEDHEDSPMLNSPATPTTTSRKRGRKPATKTENGEDTPITPAKRGRKLKQDSAASPCTPNDGPKRPGPIPTSLEAAGEADRLIIRMKDEENRPWAEINEAWMQITGIKANGSLVRMRYRHMKNNFVSVTPEDAVLLIEAKREVEEKFEQEKWSRIAKVIEEAGGNKYTQTVLLKKFKEMNRAKAAPSAPSTPLKDEA